MIELKVKAREAVNMTTGMTHMITTMPARKAMRFAGQTIVCYTSYDMESVTTIYKEVKDQYGNVIELSKAEQCEWEDRDKGDYVPDN